MAEAAPAHARSEGTINPALRVFKVPPTDISIDAYRMVTIQPTTTGINPMEFIIPVLDDFVDLGRSYFTMELSLKKTDNGNLVANEKLWPVNNLVHSIIKQIDLQLNGTLISPQSDTYHYKAYLENLLNFDREDGKTVLGPQGWFNQLDFPPQWTANNTNSTTPHADYTALSANHKVALAASVAETAKYAADVTHSLVFTPHLEVFHTGKVLVPGVEIKMKFHFNSPNLFLNGVALAGRLMEGNVKLRFQEANRFKRQDLLQHANADQINAVSELVLNLLKNNIPVTPLIIAQLRPYKKVLRNLGRCQHSGKKRREWLVQQKGQGLFQGLHNVLCQCARPTR